MTSHESGWLRAARTIDVISEKIGLVVSWIIVALVLAITYEVISRYLFHSPTLWAYDMTYMGAGAFFMLGAAYALRLGAHIRTDFLSSKWSPRTRAIIDAVAYVLLFFPALTLLFWWSLDAALYSFDIGERSDQSSWRPFLWPFKSTIAIAFLLLLLQGVSELIKSIYSAWTGDIVVTEEKIEL